MQQVSAGFSTAMYLNVLFTGPRSTADHEAELNPLLHILLALHLDLFPRLVS